MSVNPRNTSRKRNAGRDGRPVFLYQSVLGELRSRMAAGAFAGGNKLPGLKQIAAEFDVSVMTVRRALDVLEQEGQVRRVAGVGIFTPVPGQTERGGLAFISTFLNSPFQSGIAHGAQRAGQQFGRPLAFLDGQFDAELEMRNLSRLPSSGIAGAVVLPPFRDPSTLRTLQDLHRSGFPMVVVDMTLPGIHTDFVTSDHEAAAYEATSYLLTQRTAPVLFLTHPPVASSVLSRIQGYERALWDIGAAALAQEKIWINPDEQGAGFEQERRWWGGYRAVLPVLREQRGPLSILAVDAYAGWGVYEACEELGLRIPEDVSIVAFDETEFAPAIRPPMTVIRQSVEELGRTAVDLLLRRIQAGPSIAGTTQSFNHVVIGVQMIERASVGPAPSKPAAG
jgi:LacI family transcriptional regulator